MKEKESQFSMETIRHSPGQAGPEEIELKTNLGIVQTRYHEAGKKDLAVIWVGGAGGGLDGPAGGLYPRMSDLLLKDEVASLRIDYRFPNALKDCILDIFFGIEFLRKEAYERIVLIGHSFGGAVVISAGALSDDVCGVIALSSQTYGTDMVAKLAGTPLLLIHGTADEILPSRCSEDIYHRALEPKEIILYPGCMHGLDQCQERLDKDLQIWIRNLLKKQ
ncbi:MAG TPA: alpha/beta hydrolase [Cytophagaceae bacterium]|jgi:hypothetical protein